MEQGPGMADRTTGTAVTRAGDQVAAPWSGRVLRLLLSQPLFVIKILKGEGWSHMVVLTHREARQWLVSQKLLTGLCSLVMQEAPVQVTKGDRTPTGPSHQALPFTDQSHLGLVVAKTCRSPLHFSSIPQ